MVHLGLENQSTRARSDRQVASLLSGADRSVPESRRRNDKAAGHCRNLFDVYRGASHLQRRRARRRVGATQEFTAERSCQQNRGFPVAHSLPAVCGFTPAAERVSRSALAFAANELLDAAIRFVVGHLNRRMLRKIGRRRMQHAAYAAIKRKFAATDGIDGYAG